MIISRLNGIFIAHDRFRSEADLRSLVVATYTADGETVPSLFMKEVGLSGYEPQCIEWLSRGGMAP